MMDSDDVINCVPISDGSIVRVFVGSSGVKQIAQISYEGVKNWIEILTRTLEQMPQPKR